MNEQEYINNPNHCPVCGSDDFRQDDSAYDDTYHWLYLRCMDCDSEWTEEYNLSKVWVTRRNKWITEEDEPTQDLDTDNNDN